jgi:hypothetical protein
MVTDAANGHVFVSSNFNTGGSDVAVLDESGNVVADIAGESNASGMVVNGGTLYVALCTGTAIDEISTTTLLKTGSISVPSGIFKFNDHGVPLSQCALAKAGGKLWFATGDGSGGAVLASVTLAAPHTLTTYPGLEAPGGLLTASGKPNELVVLGATVAVYDVSTSTPTLVSSHAAPSGCGGGSALSADGNTVYLPVSTGECATTFAQAFDVATFHAGAMYRGGGYVDAIAVSADGHVAVGSFGFIYNPGTTDVWVYPPGQATPNLTYAVGSPGAPGVARDGLMFNAAASRLFAVDDDPGAAPSVQMAVIDDPTKDESDLTISSTPVEPAVTTQTTLLGTLSFPDGASPAGLEVTLSADPASGPELPLGQATADASGNYSLVMPQGFPSTGVWTIRADYPGDSTHRLGFATQQITVVMIKPTITVTLSPKTIIAGRTATVKVLLTNVDPGTPVTITRTAGGVTSVLATAEIGNDLSYSTLVHPKQNTTYTATYAGDATHLPAKSVKQTLNVAPVITGALSGAYARNGSYRLFHYHASCASRASMCPLFSVRTIPNLAGKRVFAVVQQHTRRGWKSVVAFRKTLNKRSRATFNVRYANTTVIGHKYRLVAVYKGDTNHTAIAWGYWYFEITR